MSLQSLPAAARQYGRDQRAEIGAAVSAINRIWRRMGDDFDAGYASIEPELLSVLDSAQGRIVTGSIEATPEILAATAPRALNRSPEWELAPAALIGTAGDGMPTESLAYGSVIHAKTAVKGGATAAEALSSAGKWLSTATGTLLSDTGRSAEKVTALARQNVTFVRMLQPPSCGRCVILAGKKFRRQQAFERHPGCFPAGAVVSGPAPEAATRRWYEGELVVIHTASGKKLTATGNHPVLADQGWVPANLLAIGDYVLSSTLPQGAIPLAVPNEQQAPALIENVWGADSMVPLGQVPTSAEDFHGDGGHGDVDVVLPNRLLGHDSHVALDEFVDQVLLARRVGASSKFAGERPGEQLLVAVLDPANGFVGSGGLGGPLGRGHARRTLSSSHGLVADLDTLLHETVAKSGPTHLEALAEAVLTLSGLVGGHDLSIRQNEMSPRWDAPAGPLTVESRVAYAGRGKDLAHRLSGQVARDRVVKVERVEWSGHVYNLTSSEGWYVADGFIVSNCDCRNIPAAESLADDLLVNPETYLSSLSEEELIRALGSKANAEAWDLGADTNQLINAYRKSGGVRPAQVYGRTVKYTTEGTTRRGLAYKAMSRAGYAQKELDERAGRYFRTRAPRLMPESCFAIAENRDDARRLLRLYGWVL